MNQEQYSQRRAEMIRDFYFQKSRRCRLNARARIRAIAKLDLEQSGIPIEQTKELFHYDEI